MTPQTSSTLRKAALSLLVAALSARGQTTTQTTTTPAISVPTVSQLSLTPFSGQAIQENRGCAALWQTLEQLHTWASVMTIVAHPDDEDGGMLAFEARGVGARTAIMTLTRGEGGQNAMSSQSFDALALVRTNELLDADSWYAGSGITQYFGRVADYGFSKTMDEALAQWGHDRVLYDAVRVVRMNRPLVVTSTFVGGITDGHGHHQVAGLLAQEVFKYAGDPKYYPDQIAAGLRPWKPLKVYARQPFFSVTSKGMFDYATGKWAPVLFHNYIDDTEMHGVPPVNVSIPEGTYDPILGESYFQIARTGLGQQRTQHEGPSIPLAGEASVGYHRYGAALPPASLKERESSFFDGIDTTLPGLATLAHSDAPFLLPALKRINEKVSSALLNYIPAHPERTAPDLHDGYMLTQQLIGQIKTSSLSDADKYNLIAELDRKLDQFNAGLAEALGLEVSAYAMPPEPTDANRNSRPGPLGLQVEAAQRVLVPGSEINVRLHISSGLGAGAVIGKTDLETPAGEHWQVTRVSAHGLEGYTVSDSHFENSASGNGSSNHTPINGDVVFHVAVPMDAAPTAPYYSRPSNEQAFYNVNDPQWLNHPFAPYPLTGEATLDYDGVPIHLASTVQTSHMVDGLGSVFEPLLVTPALSITLDGHSGILPLHMQRQFTLPVTLRSDAQGSSDGDVKLALPQGWTADPASTHFHIAQGESRTISFMIHPGSFSTQTYTIKAVVQSGNHEYSSGYIQAGYAGIRPYNLYAPATYSITGADVTVAPGLKIGYVMGTGDDIPTALTELGAAPHLLTASDILSSDLSTYDTILIGIRAYATRPELSTANARLLNFVHSGGTLIVEYQGPEYDHNFGPYSYILGNSPERVVDEKDPVTILAPSDPLLNFPNHITATDFDHWVEERGHSFMQSWSPHYTALTETHDPGEDPQQGGLLYSKYGSGTYIYLAYALYRETPEAVPGAFRLLANLISAGKTAGAPVAGK